MDVFQPSSSDDASREGEQPSGTAPGSPRLRTFADAEPILPVTTPRLEQRKVMGRGSDTMVVVSRSKSKAFRPQEGDTLQATEEALEPQTRMGKLLDRVKRIVVGRPIATEQGVLSSDAISSVAYATEASLGVLILAGAGSLPLNLIIALAIAMLMVVVGISYRQTIAAYPNGGGSYIVAKDNLGTLPGLIAAAALMIDYVLTVAVSVSAGIDALVSPFENLRGFSVELGVAFTLLIMFVNLRGVRESGSIFAVPTYLFITGFLIMIVTGVISAAFSAGGLFTPVRPSANLAQLGWHSTETLGILLILKAFASGCSAMTGVEAISDGVPAFQKPEWKNAQQTLTWMVTVLVTLFLGTTYLAWRFGAEPHASGNPTVTSQVAQHLFSGNFTFMYFFVQITTLFVLVLAANTSFSDFPRLASFLARDKHLPSQFAFRGDRLAFSTGIIALTVLAVLLQIAFSGNTATLINLYALGVFTAFTLSQSGMVVHWWRKRESAGRNWRRSMVVNALGATATALVTVIIGISKFWGEQTIATFGTFQLKDGAWIVLILIPLLVLMFYQIARHYDRAGRLAASFTPLRSEELHHIIIVPIASLNVPAMQGIAFGRSITPNVIAVHIVGENDDTGPLREQWMVYISSRRERWANEAQLRAAELGDRPGAAYEVEAIKRGPQLVKINSPYRALVSPLVAYVRSVRDLNPQATVTVVLPEFVPAHFWEGLLHNQSAFRLKLALYREPRVIVVNIPYHLAGAGETVTPTPESVG
jgi:amino acid transporter